MEYKVSEVVKIISGGTPKRKNSEYWNGEIPWLSVKDFNNKNRLVHETEEQITEAGLNNSAATLVSKGTVVISARGTVGELCQVAKSMTFNQSCFGLEAISKYTTNEYIYYWFKYKTNYIKSNTHGSVFDTINRKTFENLYIYLPNISYQKQVVNILKTLDNKIEINQNIIANLEELSQTLFKRWFVDFEFPDENGNPYKSSGGEMVDSELGEIPINWNLVKLGSIANIRTGYAFKSTEYIEQIQLPVLRTLNISKSNLLVTMNDIKFVPYQYLYMDKYQKYNLELFDTLLVTVGGSIGNLGLVTENNLPSLQNQNMWRFRSIKSNISNTLIYQLILYVNSLVYNQTSGSAREFYTKKTFENFNLLLPKLDSYLYESINKYLENFGKKISDLNVEIEKLTQLRDTLLPKLMSGEIEIPDHIEVNEDELSI
ncbi:MAG: restriction endonuclease subunit S [Staphylococcus equorum]|uniref:restriction endonuclease subunit S n=1 Tax=Staphylococcus TaxID=1279 RepID=UPI002556A47E|nr:restriction endonuclease subunit S [Staphylococcus equorum]MDK9877486.1 restriction endonuclease subunit S [Staphylococcus equorum]MDN6612185.1 restriction endonuclease subunit S [Staphylococcus equorum]MDN6742887.1 restriction endonuclease subunit S [Staphylococcus equorum]